MKRGFGEDEKSADQSRTLVDVICSRVVKPDYDIGALPLRPTAQELVDFYTGDSSSLASAFVQEPQQQQEEEVLAEKSPAASFTKALIKTQEWEEISQRVLMWQDTADARADGCNIRAVLLKVLGKIKRFPTLQKVSDLLGEDAAERYKASMETIESNSSMFSEFPEEKTAKGWNQMNCERAVALVTDVISPYGDDPIGMADAYARYMAECRAQAKERGMVGQTRVDERKAFARSLGIWLPRPTDHRQWRSDPRTRENAPEFLQLSEQVFDRMRLARSILQYVRKRKFSEKSVADMEANMIRMRAYLRTSKESPEMPQGVPIADGDHQQVKTSIVEEDDGDMLFCFSGEDDDISCPSSEEEEEEEAKKDRKRKHDSCELARKKKVKHHHHRSDDDSKK